MRYLIICFLLFTALGVEAQTSEAPRANKEKQHKGYIGVYIGPSFPVGNFGDRSWNNDKAGFAKRGLQTSVIDFGVKFVPKFGIAATVKFTYYPMDVQYLADQYAQEYGGQFTVSAKRWGFGGFHAGPFLCIPFKHADLDFRLLTGLMIATAPSLTVTQNATGQTQFQDSNIGSSLSISFGTGVRIHVTPSMSVMLHAEYQWARPTFVYDNYPGNNYQTTTVYQNVTTVNTLIGVALRIF